MREPVLSGRMRAICEMVTPGRKVADVGCDHGFVSIWLVQRGICPGAIAMDVREGPLSGARAHVEAYGLDRYIETRLSDGLRAFCAGEAQTLICAGMGGRLMRRILEEESAKAKSFEELILQPQSELSEFRSFLRREGYFIRQENMVKEEGKYYFLLKAVPEDCVTPKMKREDAERCHGLYERYCARTQERPGEEEWTASLRESFGDWIGLPLLAAEDPVLWEYLQRGLESDRAVLGSLSGQDSARARTRLLELQEEIERYRSALDFYRR